MVKVSDSSMILSKYWHRYFIVVTKYSSLDGDRIKHVFKNLTFLLHKRLSSLDFCYNSVLTFLLLLCIYQRCGYFLVFCFVVFWFIFFQIFLSVICEMVSCLLYFRNISDGKVLRFLKASGNRKSQFWISSRLLRVFLKQTYNWQGAKWFYWFCICLLC